MRTTDTAAVKRRDGSRGRGRGNWLCGDRHQVDRVHASTRRVGTQPMSSGSALKGGRDVVAYFAGHLANLVNGNDALTERETSVAIKPFSLYEKVRRALVGNRRYSEILVGVWAYPPPNTAEDAADFYFDNVLERPIGSRGEGPSSADNLAALIGSHAIGPRAVRPAGPLSIWKALVGGGTSLRRFADKRDLF